MLRFPGTLTPPIQTKAGTPPRVSVIPGGAVFWGRVSFLGKGGRRPFQADLYPPSLKHPPPGTLSIPVGSLGLRWTRQPSGLTAAVSWHQGTAQRLPLQRVPVFSGSETGLTRVSPLLILCKAVPLVPSLPRSPPISPGFFLQALLLQRVQSKKYSDYFPLQW